MQPDFEANIYMYCYFIGFIIIGLFLPLTMLVGVILANFNKHKIKISINIKHIYKNVLLQMIDFGFNLMSFLFGTHLKKD